MFLQAFDHKKSVDVLVMYGAAMTKKGGIRMSKEVRDARSKFLKEREEEKLAAALEADGTIWLS